MFSPVFDGQFRSKPSVSLRGASKQGEPSASLLEKARQLREKRELQRRRNQAAAVIQATYRAHCVRKEVYTQLRTDFDRSINQCTNHTHLIQLTNRLMLFYNEIKDHSRLITLSHKWIQFRVPLASELTTPTNHTHNTLCHLLTLCLTSLSHDPSQPLAGCLRVLDVFCDKGLYSRQGEPNPIESILHYLISRGYYSTLRKVLEKRLPSPDEDTLLNLPLATTLLQYIERAIMITGKQSFSSILHELLAPPLTSHLCYMIVPSLVKLHIPLESLLEVALDQSICGHLIMSPTLCYCLLLLSETCTDTLTDVSVGSLLTVISKTLELRVQEKSRQLSHEEEEDDLDDVEDMELDPLGGSQALISCILDKVNNGYLVDRLGRNKEYVPFLLNALCSTCYQLLISGTLSPYRSQLLRKLSFSSPLLRQIWQTLDSLSLTRSFGPSIKCIDHLARGSALPREMGVSILELCSCFACLFSLSLSSLHDAEVVNLGPFPLDHLASISLKLKDLFVVLHLETHLPVTYNATPLSDQKRPHPSEWKFLSNLLCRLLKQLHDRNTRLHFCSDSNWISHLTIDISKIPPQLFLEQDEEEMPSTISQTILKHAELLKKAPFVFSFPLRVNFFHHLIAHSRMSSQGHLQDFMMGPALHITARRTHLYEDAFAKLSMEDLRKKLRINLINAQGLDEAGIDGGGLFREFLSETLKTAFDPNRGFFTTTQDGSLYPNPQVHLINEDHPIHYKFLGALLGKVLYEQMMVELPFAPFFLRKLTTPGRGWVDTHHLSSLDPELYRHLLSLKNYEGSFEEMNLDFTTLSNEYGYSKVIDLKPGGGNIPVTWSNHIEYIHLLSHYHLNTQLDSQFKSFRYGINSVIPLLWLSLFNEQELQTLISGAEVPIDLNDLYKHTEYSGEYNHDHMTIQYFWEVVRDFTEEQKRQLLKFVTSCSRPPLFGFYHLHPPFTILSAKETSHLPSASTCMNLLKLPMFSDKTILREKLIYAISSGAGFELS